MTNFTQRLQLSVFTVPLGIGTHARGGKEAYYKHKRTILQICALNGHSVCLTYMVNTGCTGRSLFGVLAAEDFGSGYSKCHDRCIGSR